MITAGVLSACADRSTSAPEVGMSTLRVVNALADSSMLDVMVANIAVQTNVPFGAAAEVPIPSSTLPVFVGVRHLARTAFVRLDQVAPGQRVLLLAHGSGTLAALEHDTSTVRADRFSVRVAFVAIDAPLVKVYIQPVDRSSFGPEPALLMGAAYSVPFVTPYLRGTPAAGEYAAYFVSADPATPDRLLAVTGPFRPAASSAWMVLLDRVGSVFWATVVREPTICISVSDCASASYAGG